MSFARIHIHTISPTPGQEARVSVFVVGANYALHQLCYKLEKHKNTYERISKRSDSILQGLPVSVLRDFRVRAIPSQLSIQDGVGHSDSMDGREVRMCYSQ
jgi:hypothetical protein